MIINLLKNSKSQYHPSSYLKLEMLKIGFFNPDKMYGDYIFQEECKVKSSHWVRKNDDLAVL